MKSAQHWLVAAASAVVASQAVASDLTVKLTLPEIASAGFRPPTRPYVAIWLRKADNSFAGDLAVWYQINARQRRAPRSDNAGAPDGDSQRAQTARRGPENPRTPGGARWLNEVRQWWADSGNRLQFPVDGLTSASRPAGAYELTFASSGSMLAQVPAGKYKLMVEASREHGGDETVSIPFTWPATTRQTGRASGKTELGAVELVVTP